MALRLIITFLFIICFINIDAQNISRHNALKTTILSWSTGSVKLFYEHHSKGINIDEWAIGYIGCMYDGKKNNPKGIILRYGHKFNCFLRNEEKPLQGLYIRPELNYVNFRYNPKDNSPRTRSEMLTLMSIIGYQYIYKRFAIDFFTGPGYVIGNEADTWYEHSFTLWDYFGTKNKNISYTMGFKVGYTF